MNDHIEKWKRFHELLSCGFDYNVAYYIVFCGYRCDADEKSVLGVIEGEGYGEIAPRIIIQHQNN